MEVNKEEAIRCRTLGAEALRHSNYARSIKMFQKSLQLYPLPGVQALLEVVDSGAKNMEICVVRAGGSKSIMDEKDVDAIVKQIEAEAEEGKTTTATASTME